MALITRLGKGSPLTFNEGDNNLLYLQSTINNISGSYATTGSNIFVGPQTLNGTQTIFGNLIVYGTSSISYTTQSATNIGTNIITVNTNTPSVKFGGIAVFDSGSSQLSGSLLWDSSKSRWLYSNPSGSTYNSALLISGPKNTSTLGNEDGLLVNVITKGQGTDHITSSALIEDGTTLYVAVNAVITGSLTTIGTITGSLFGTSSYAVSASRAISSSYALSASYALSSSYSFTGSFAQNARSSSYALTSSYTRNAELLDGLDSTVFSSTASFTNFTASITNYTASNDLMIADILISTASLNAATSSLYIFTSSVNLTIADILVETASLQQVTASLYAFTASILNNTASANTYSASFNNRINVISGSYAVTGSNIFTDNQTIQGNLTVTQNIIANKLIVQSVTASQTYSSGSNVFGNLLTNTQTFTGSLQVTGSSHYILGNVGIGTVTPGFSLHLSKGAENNIAVDNTANNNRLLLSSRTSNTSILSQNSSTTAAVDLIFTIGTTDVIRLSSNGTNITGSVYSTGSLFNVNSLSTNITGSTIVTGSTFNWNGSQVATIAATQTLTNKTITSGSNTITGLTNANLSGTAGIVNANLATPTISGVSLGSNLYTLTQGSGLEYSAGSAYNGSAASTIGIAALGVTNAMLAGSIANAKLSNSTISGVALGSNLATLTRGSYLTGTDYNGSAAQTFAVDATSANTASKVVARDASGNFSAGTITANLTGTASGITSQANSATITATSANTANQIVLRDGSGNFSAGTITATLTGNATNISAYTINQNVGSSNSPTFTGLTINGAITATGDITAYYSSDIKLKSNIQTIPNALEKVSKLNGVTWTWNEDVNEVTKSTPNTGLIAQEVLEVLPEVITERVDGLLGLDYSKMMGLLVEAIKEQQLQIEELKKR
jgi:hypothetical protein